MNCNYLKNTEGVETNRLKIDGEIVIETTCTTGRSLDAAPSLVRNVMYRVDFNTNASELDACEEVRLKLISEAEKIEKYIKEQKTKG